MKRNMYTILWAQEWSSQLGFGVQGLGINEKYKDCYEDRERQSLDIGNTMCDIMKIQNMGSKGANKLLGCRRIYVAWREHQDFL